jgi:hypothetical protein
VVERNQNLNTKIAPRWSARTIRRGVALASLLVVGCATPMPSTQPLGRGIVPTTADTPRPEKKRRDRVAHAETHHHNAANTPDGGAPPAIAKEATASESGDSKGKEKPTAAAPQAANAQAFAGAYSGDDVATYHLEGLPDRVEKDPNAKLTVNTTDAHSLTFVLIDSSNGSDICSLSGKITDTGTTIDPGQKCFEQSGDDSSTSATVTEGTATVDGNRLVFEMNLDFSMSIGDRELTGTLQYRFQGKR